MRSIRVRLALAALAAFLFTSGIPAASQAPPAAGAVRTLEFEVATIKPFQPDPTATSTFVGGSCHGIDNDKQYQPSPFAPPPLGRCVFKGVNLTGLISISHKVAVAGGPAWAASDRFNVEGKVEDSTMATEGDLLSMLQTFLTGQFKLQSHREQRDVQGFVLSVGKGGMKLNEISCDKPSTTRFGPGTKVTAECVTIAEFVRAIRGMAGGPVTDMTGLTGKYAISFEWSNEVPGGFLAEMQSQLGLRVEAIKTPTEFLIIDRAEKPAP